MPKGVGVVEAVSWALQQDFSTAFSTAYDAVATTVGVERTASQCPDRVFGGVPDTPMTLPGLLGGIMTSVVAQK